MRKQLIFILGAFLAVGGVAGSEPAPLGFGKAGFDRELASDRPDFTETAQIVEAGHVQFEAGYTYTEDDDAGDVETHTVPELLMRVGLTSDTEFRFVWAGYLKEDVGAAGESGVSDISVGIKHSMAEETAVMPALSYLFELGLPVGSDEFTADDPELIFKMLCEKGLSDDFGVAGNLNFSALKGEKDYFLEPSSSLSFKYAFTEKAGSYIEYYGLYPVGEGVGPAHTVNGGVTYLVTPNLQLDVRAGFGLNDRADDFLAGTGLVFRF